MNLRNMGEVSQQPLVAFRNHKNYRSGPPSQAESSGSADRDKDDLLIHNFFEGSEIERSRLYKHILPLCRATIVRMVGPSHREAEDLLQSAVERIISTLVSGSFSRRCSLRTWAVAVTRNVVLNEVRVETRERRCLVDEDLDTYPDEEALLCSIERGELRDALLHLPRTMAVPLLLHDLCGYTAAEIADDLGLTSAGVQSRIWRARALARRHLANGGTTKFLGRGTRPRALGETRAQPKSKRPNAGRA